MKVGGGKLLPCTFSHILINTERNYVIFNKELLAIKVVFQEWRQLLEEVEFPIQVSIDQNSLQLMQNS